jgi:hypothetical protein
MSLPKKFLKNININPPKQGVERRQEWLDGIADKGTYLPRGISHEDMDKTFNDFVEKELEVSIDGEKVPVYLIGIQRWVEFVRNWTNSDEWKNVKLPFITITRKPDPQRGENQAGFWNIPGTPTFTYMKVPTFNDQHNGFDIYKIPQPIPIDLTYEVRFFCSKMRDLNLLNRKVMRTFKSLQAYIKVNGHPMPIILESVGDESQIEDFESKKYYVQLYQMKLQGYLLCEEDFEVIPAITRNVCLLEVDEKPKKVELIKKIYPDKRSITLNFLFRPNRNNVNILVSEKAKYETVVIDNINSYIFKVNNVTTSIPFTVNPGDELGIFIIRNTNNDAQITINGLLL